MVQIIHRLLLLNKLFLTLCEINRRHFNAVDKKKISGTVHFRNTVVPALMQSAPIINFYHDNKVKQSRIKF